MNKNEQARKLKLSRETLKNLEAGLLQKLHGGVCQTSIAQHSCPTVAVNCTTTTTA
jgi:hypothetical protein